MTVARLIREAPVGKVVGGTLYLHRSALGTLPRELREHVEAARSLAASQVEEIETTLVKIDRNGALVSFLEYEEFDASPHPALKTSVTVNVSNGNARKASYRNNRPILHRKETFVAEGYPRRSEFAALTEQEEKEGLLGRKDIGRENDWRAILRAKGLEIEGHSLRRT